MKIEKAIDSGQAGISDMALLGTIYIQMEEYDRARQVLMDAHQQEPANRQVLEALGRLEFAVGNYEAADKWLKRTGGGTAFPEQTNERKVAVLIKKSIESYHNNDFEQAKTTLEEALYLAPYNPIVLSMLIQLGKEQGNDSSLIELYRRFIVIDPANAQAYAELGTLLEKQGQPAAAEKAFLNAESFATDEPYPYFYLAITDKEPTAETITRLHLAIGKAVRKISVIQLQAAGTLENKQGELTAEDLRQLEQLSTLFTRPRQILTESILLLRECYPNSADYEADLRRLIEWYPHSLELSGALGTLLEEQQRFDEAYEHWRSILEGFSTAEEAHLGMARSLEGLGRLRRAVVAYKRARDLIPENPEVYQALNRLHTSDTQKETLHQWYTELYERERINITLLNAWADLEETMGLNEEALKHRLRAVKLEEYE